jgi:hypothetical protein
MTQDTDAREDVGDAAELFVREALEALDLIWEPYEIAREATALTDRAFKWGDLSVREAPDV